MYYDLRLSPDQLPLLLDWVILRSIREYRTVLAEYGTAISGKDKEAIEENLKLLEAEAERRRLKVEAPRSTGLLK